MKIAENLEKIFQNKKSLFSVLFFLCLAQLVSGFIFPAYPPTNDYWKSAEEFSSYKGYSYDSVDQSILGKIYPLICDYHISSDCGGMMLLANDFPQHYFRGHTVFLNRPLYPFTVYLISRPLHLISDSYSLTFVAGIFLNFILFFLTALLLYSLTSKLINPRVGILSSFLFIFSPFAHVWLSQPETNIFGAFMVMLSLYLIYNYIKAPSQKKLIIYSLVVGVLMLGKMLFAISIFVLLLAFIYKRYREGITFFIIHVIPVALWYLWVTKVWGLVYFSAEITDYNMGVWLINIFYWPWFKTAGAFLSALPRYFSSLVYGFLLVPVIFAALGYKSFSISKKNLILFGFAFSFFAQSFIADLFSPRHGFLIFPLVLPLAVMGIDKTADFLKQYINPKLFYLVVYAFLIIISSVNFFKIFPYDGVLLPWGQ